MNFVFYQEQLKSIYSIKKSIKGDGLCYMSFNPVDTPSIAKITLFDRSNIVGIYNIFIYATNNITTQIHNMKLPKNIYFPKGNKLLIKLNITENEIIFITNITDDDISCIENLVDNININLERTTFIERWTKETIIDTCIECEYENTYIATYNLPINAFKDFINMFNIDNIIDVFIKHNKICFKTFIVLDNNIIKKLECVQPLMNQINICETFSFNGLSLVNLKNIITFNILEDEKLFKDVRVDIYKAKNDKFVLIFKPSQQKTISIDKNKYIFNTADAIKMFIIQN